MSPELVTLTLGLTPGIEVDGAIPYAIISGITPVKAYLLALAGSLIPLIPMLFFWRFIAKYFKHRLPRHKGRYFQVTGLITLGLFVAIPLPYTGVYTAAIFVALFDFPLWKSAFAILLGVLVDAGIVLAITLGAKSIF